MANNTLHNYMTAAFTGAQNTNQNAAGWYQQVTDPYPNNNYNCFANAVNVHNRAIVEQTRAQLEEAYSREGYFPVSAAGAPQVGDAEVYAKPSEPNQIVHAHRVTAAGMASSKLGGGELINHRIATLQAPKHGSTASYEYGTVRYRFRYNAQKYSETWEKTRSGRLRRRPQSDDNNAAAKKAKTTAGGGGAAAASKTTAAKTTTTKAAPAKKAAKK